MCILEIFNFKLNISVTRDAKVLGSIGQNQVCCSFFEMCMELTHCNILVFSDNVRLVGQVMCNYLSGYPLA